MGTVKWFNPLKGYGFIRPDGGGQDAFVHISALEKAGYTSLSEGLNPLRTGHHARGQDSGGCSFCIPNLTMSWE